MQRLSPEQVVSFMERHRGFHDSLIQCVELRFTGGVSGRRVNVELEVQDQTSQDYWGRVRFEFHGVTLLSLLEDNTTNVVLSHGIELTVRTNGIVADFSPIHADEERSTFLISAHEVWYESIANVPQVHTS